MSSELVEQLSGVCRVKIVLRAQHEWQNRRPWRSTMTANRVESYRQLHQVITTSHQAELSALVRRQWGCLAETNVKRPNARNGANSARGAATAGRQGLCRRTRSPRPMSVPHPRVRSPEANWYLIQPRVEGGTDSMLSARCSGARSSVGMWRCAVCGRREAKAAANSCTLPNSWLS